MRQDLNHVNNFIGNICKDLELTARYKPIISITTRKMKMLQTPIIEKHIVVISLLNLLRLKRHKTRSI